MSTIDLLTRVNGIIKKYEKYDTDKPKEGPAIASHDHFLKLYRTIEDDLNDILKVRGLPMSENLFQIVTSLTGFMKYHRLCCAMLAI